jgi:hypothetical protein
VTQTPPPASGAAGRMPDVAGFLQDERQAALQAALASLARMHVRHYEASTPDTVEERLASLFDQLVESIARRDLAPVVEHARRVATERFHAGYDLGEVQTAFNALEEAAWMRALERLEPSELAEALGLISTVLGAGKDALARTYVSLASNTSVESLDLRALFAGTP